MTTDGETAFVFAQVLHAQKIKLLITHCVIFLAIDVVEYTAGLILKIDYK